MSTVTAADEVAIVEVVDRYIAGFNELDADAFRSAFHPEARMQLTDAAGAYRSVRLSDIFGDWSSPPGSRIEGRVLQVTQAGDVAVVLLGYDNHTHPDRCWVDALSLLRVDGAWRIVNKSCTHASRGGWAGSGGA